MTKFFLPLAATAALFTSPAAAESFVHNGATYDYVVQQDGNARVIKGTDDKGRNYSLRVANGRVRGTVNGNAVSFSLKSVRPVVAVNTDLQTAAR